MPVRVKFCGLTRRADVETALALGADYLGMVFASGPRRLDPDAAAQLMAGVTEVPLVGVVGAERPEGLTELLGRVPLQVLQCHADPTAEELRRARVRADTAIWGVLRIAPDAMPALSPELLLAADAVVLDTRSASRLGGTGATFDWGQAAQWIAPYRTQITLVLAGGLTPANVAEAVRTLRPDVVDVSSGVEVTPGVKDPDLMRRFADAARSV